VRVPKNIYINSNRKLLKRWQKNKKQQQKSQRTARGSGEQNS